MVMYGGKDVETAPVSEIIGNSKHPYTSGLIECLPDTSKSTGRLVSIPGTTPNPLEMPQGCAFHPRCPKAMKICSQQEPQETTISKEHKVKCHLYT